MKVPEQRIEPQGIKIKADLDYKEQPVGIVDTKERVTRNRVVKTYKVVWSHLDDTDATWETEDYLKTLYPKFHKKWLVTQISGRDLPKGGKAVTPYVLSLHLVSYYPQSFSSSMGISMASFEHDSI